MYQTDKAGVEVYTAPHVTLVHICHHVCTCTCVLHACTKKHDRAATLLQEQNMPKLLCDWSTAANDGVTCSCASLGPNRPAAALAHRAALPPGLKLGPLGIKVSAILLRYQFDGSTNLGAPVQHLAQCTNIQQLPSEHTQAMPHTWPSQECYSVCG